MEWLINSLPGLHANQIQEVTRWCWQAYYHFSGSTTRDIPYEILYCLELALKRWDDTASIMVATALRDDKEFYCIPITGVHTLVEQHTPGGPAPEETAETVFIALPRIYKNFPLFSLPLYHELGHFVERKHNIAGAINMLHPEDAIIDLPEMPEYIALFTSEKEKSKIRINYFCEIFSDIFAACFLGEAMANALEAISDADDKCTYSHPSTRVRVQIIRDFLAGTSPKIVGLFHWALNIKLGERNPGLTNFQVKPALAPYFDNHLPIPLKNDREVHGLLTAAWEYLEGKQNAKEKEVAEINDLVEKSIRSYAIQDKWHDASHQEAS